MLEIKNIFKSFGEKQALDDVSFTAVPGSALGLLGRNGAGKTTTIRIVMDMFPPDSGQVLFDGATKRNSKQRIGYLPEERGLYPKKKVNEQLIYLAELQGMARSDAVKRAMLLLDKLDAGEYFTRTLESLSKGNQQKVQLAASLISDPDIIILDEPFSGLDPVSAMSLRALVNELVSEKKTVIFSSHQMSHVEQFCDDICIINAGKVVLTGRLKDIKKAYPRNKLLLRFESPTERTTLLDIFRRDELPVYDDSITTISETEYIVFSDKLDHFRNKILSALVGYGTQIEKYEVMEPTLEQIFVEKAGGAE